jgi:hypothetical protein
VKAAVTNKRIFNFFAVYGAPMPNSDSSVFQKSLSRDESDFFSEKVIHM